MSEPTAKSPPESPPDSPPESTNETLPPDWTLEVEGLGPIQKAQIRPAKLTLLVGDNNSGKSYLATLLWGMQCRLRLLLFEDSRAIERPTFQLALSWLKGVAPRARTVIVPPDILASLAGWIGEALTHGGMGLLLNRPDYVPQRIEFVRHPGFNSVSLPFSPKERSILQKHPHQNQVCLAVVASQFLDTFRTVAPDSCYLPASRTGFMLLRQKATQDALQRTFGSDDSSASKQRLSMPMLELLEALVYGIGQRRGPFADEADLLEQSLGGTLIQKQGEVGMPDYRYRPAGTNADLGLHATSSMVTELAPIILTLRYARNLPFLVIEEPEAHLHPKIQRALARTLVRLVRRGVRLVITTHSDLFCQQINNCLKLGGRSDAERAALQTELGYRPEEYLLDDEVRGYCFTNLPDGSGSEVRELAHTPYGIEMPSFIQELDRLMSETAALDRAIPVPTGESA